MVNDQDYSGDKLLDSVRRAGVTNIRASGVDTEYIRIEVYHDKNKNNNNKHPIVSEVPQQMWYGDVVDAFQLEAEAVGFTPADVMEISKDIANIVYEMGDMLLKHRQQVVEKEVEQRKQQLAAAGIITEGPTEPHVEGSNIFAGGGDAGGFADYVDWTKPQPVKRCLQSKPNTVYTMYGQITSKGLLHHKIKGAEYRCGNCSMINYQGLSRPADTGDTEVPQTLYGTMCRFCARQNLDPKSPEYKNATTLRIVRPDVINSVDIEVSDTERFDEVDSLKVVLLGKDAENVKVGEYCQVRGKHQSVPPSRRSSRSYPVCYAYGVTYNTQEARKLTPADIKRVKKCVQLMKNETDYKTKKVLGDRNIINRLRWMSGHHVIGCEDAKEAVLYTETSVGDDVIGKGSDKVSRQRLHTGLVGGPGSSKTTVSMIALLHDQRNNFENAQSSSMKTLTAIVTREGGDSSKPVLRTGRLATTKAAVLILNELAEVSMDDQKYIQDSMEEGQFTVNKLGVRAVIRADTAMIWTGNPKQGADFARPDSIDLDEIAVRKQTIDRTDLLVVMRPIKDPVKRREFNRKVLRMHKDLKDPAKRRIIRNYDEYVNLHVLYARTLKPIMSDEAEEILSDAETRLQEIKFRDGIANAGSNRALGTLERLATVIAKLKLHDDEIMVEDANDAIDFYNKISSQIHQAADKPSDPAQNAAEAMVYILQNESKGIAIPFRELCERAANKEEAIRYYLYQGIKNRLGDVSSNKRTKRTLEILEGFNPKKLQRVKMQPAEFLWVGEDGDEEGGGGGESESKEEEREEKEEGVKEEEKEKDNTQREESSKESLHADLPDSADQGSTSLQENKQTELIVQQDKNITQKAVQGEKGESARSASVIVEDSEKNKKQKQQPTSLEEKEDKVLMACGLAVADYNSEKIQGRESGAHIDTYGVWAHMQQEFPNENWSERKVRKVLEGLVQKGRLLTKQGDEPDRWYII